MSFSTLGLAIVMFLNSAIHFGWFAVSAPVLGFFEIIAAVALVIEGGPVLYRKYIIRH